MSMCPDNQVQGAMTTVPGEGIQAMWLFNTTVCRCYDIRLLCCAAEPCQQHLQAAAAARRAALLVYEAAEVMVELVSEQELPAAFTGTGGEPSMLLSEQPVHCCGVHWLCSPSLLAMCLHTSGMLLGYSRASGQL